MNLRVRFFAHAGLGDLTAEVPNRLSLRIAMGGYS